jgi:B12-binding domain/radical SAM domain protein
MRHRSISVVEKYARYYEDLRFISPNAFAYGSDGLTPRPDKVKCLLESLARLGKKIYFGTFPCEVRPEFISKEMLEIVTKHCTNTILSIGAQSGSPRLLREIKRGHSVQDIINGAELCLEYDFIPKVDFIFGLPREKHEDQMQSLKLIEWICSKGGLIHAHHFIPLPGTTYEHENPSPISREVKKVLGKLALKGKASGVWQPSHVNEDKPDYPKTEEDLL